MSNTDLYCDAPVDSFERFVEQARPLVVGNMVEAIEDGRPRLEQVWPWLLDHDLLTVAGAAFVEDAYTELVAWALYPPGETEIALACQRAWLSELGIANASSIENPAVPHTQFVTKGGRPDLVMDYRDDHFVLAVELKTGSEEHETPHGGMQTVVYPRLVAKAMSLPKQCDVEMVFLTPSGIQAANEKAINTTYHLFVASLSRALEGHELTPSLKWSYSTIFTHLLRHASPKGINGTQILRDVWTLLGTDAGTISDDALLANLSTLTSSILLLAPGDDDMSEQFTGFDKATTLYAQNFPLIQQMQSMFDQTMLLFAHDLETAIKKHVPPKLLKIGRSKRRRDDPRPCPARHICLADDDKGAWLHAFLMLDMRNVSAAADHQWTLVADAPHASQQQLRRLWKVPDQEHLSAFCKLRGRQDRKFFEVTVDLSDDDSLDGAGERIASVLKAMYKAETGRAAR